MGFFDLFNKSKRAQATLDYMAERNCSDAINFARCFNKDLDYSSKSIADLEEILEYYSKNLLKSNPTEKQIMSMSVIFGSYLGQTLLKQGFFQKGYRWAKEDDASPPLLMAENGSFLTPIDKVYKRLTGGKAESVLSFYTAAIKNLQ